MAQTVEYQRRTDGFRHRRSRFRPHRRRVPTIRTPGRVTVRPPHLSRRPSHELSYGGGSPAAVHVGTRSGVVSHRGRAAIDSDRPRHDCGGTDRRRTVRRTGSPSHPPNHHVHRHHRRFPVAHRGDGIRSRIPCRVVRVCTVGSGYGRPRAPPIDPVLAPARRLRARDVSRAVRRSGAVPATDGTLDRPDSHGGRRRRRATVRHHRRVRAAGRFQEPRNVVRRVLLHPAHRQHGRLRKRSTGTRPSPVRSA